MKLRNKRTGEIGNLVLNINPNRESYSVLSTENGDTICGNIVIGDYDTLAQLNEEWEDYEETALEEMIKKLENDFKEYPEEWNNLEEAEKAVEKLKAWKRLKDNGFKFEGWERCRLYYGDFTITATDQTSCDNKDLDLLFGGEE